MLPHRHPHTFCTNNFLINPGMSDKGEHYNVEVKSRYFDEHKRAVLALAYATAERSAATLHEAISDLWKQALLEGDLPRRAERHCKKWYERLVKDEGLRDRHAAGSRVVLAEVGDEARVYLCRC